MQNINELFDNRDMIIESMGYFNPLIVGEYNNVVVTEGIVGGIVEKIKALGKMIKGWLQKLIDWVAGKFNNLGIGKSKKSESKDKKSDSLVAQTNRNIAATEKKYQDQIKNSETSKKLDAILADKSIENKLKQTEMSVPKLVNAKDAVNALIQDCQKALGTDNPMEQFSKKTPRDYFRKQGMEKMKPADVIKNPVYLSYNRKAGKDCVDRIRSYQKNLEASYTQLERTASSVTDKDRANQLLTRAKNINMMTQKVLGSGVKWLSNYAEEVTQLVTKANQALKGA